MLLFIYRSHTEDLEGIEICHFVVELRDFVRQKGKYHPTEDYEEFAVIDKNLLLY